MSKQSRSKIQEYFETCAESWACDDNVEQCRSNRTWEDPEFNANLHFNNDLEDWRSTFESPFIDPPVDPLTDEEVKEVLRLLRERFPWEKHVEYVNSLQEAVLKSMGAKKKEKVCECGKTATRYLCVSHSANEFWCTECYEKAEQEA